MRLKWIKLALLGLLILPDFVIWPALLEEVGWASFLRIPAAFLLLIFGLIAAAFTQSTSLRLFFALILSAGVLVIQGYRFAVGEPTLYFNFVTTIDARSAFADAFAMHAVPLLAAALLAVLCFVAIAIRPPPMARKWTWLAPLVVLSIYGGLIAVLIDRHGQIRGIPAAWHGVGYATMYGIDWAQGSSGKRELVSIARFGSKPSGDIVLIVDESVSGNYLDLNAAGGGRSGLIDPPAGWATHDFGIAVSPSNCSMQSNVLLRFGGLRGNFKQKVARGPSIWAYAHGVGMKTVYLYGQRGGLNENYMTDAERMEIDDARYFREIEPTKRDHHIAGELAAYLVNDTPEFILVNKVGAHFPLTHSSPDGAYLGEKNAFGVSGAKDAKFWRNYRQHYRKALSWTVGGFFDILLRDAATATAPVTIIYTSDHGQAFYEREAPGSVTHCRTRATSEEGAVPLVIIKRGVDGAFDWGAAAGTRHNASSATRIFPSVLMTMGYGPAAVRAEYGSSLADNDADPMIFGVKMIMKQGAQPDWIKVDPAKLFRPQADVATRLEQQ